MFFLGKKAKNENQNYFKNLKIKNDKSNTFSPLMDNYNHNNQNKPFLENCICNNDIKKINVKHLYDNSSNFFLMEANLLLIIIIQIIF